MTHFFLNLMHREGFEPSTSGFVDRRSNSVELPVRYGFLNAPWSSRLSGLPVIGRVLCL